MSLPDLVQVVCSEKQTARLSLRAGDREADIFFEHGDIAHAVAGSLEGKRALFEAMGWRHGRFELSVGVGPPARTVRGSWSGLLLEGAEWLDRRRGKPKATGAGESPGEWLPTPLEFGSEHQLGMATAGAAGSPIASPETLRPLRALPDVLGSLSALPSGTVVARDRIRDGDAESIAALAVFLIDAARRLSEDLALGTLDRVTLDTPLGRLLVLDRSSGPVALVLADTASPDLVRAALPPPPPTV